MSNIDTQDKTEQHSESHHPKEKQTSKRNPTIDRAVRTFIHRVWDIEECATKFVSLAKQDKLLDELRIRSELDFALSKIKSEDSNRIQYQTLLFKALQNLNRLDSSAPVEVLERSLFVSSFSVFDKFMEDLMIALYFAKPILYKNINIEVPLSDALTYNSMDELRYAYLQKDIETLKRKSYADQFLDLEKRFKISLTKFSSWPMFIEMAQRRNLFTHCDGVVSKQYLDACSNAGLKLDTLLNIGTQLSIGEEYFFTSCTTITEVAIMLGHTLWRKIIPEETVEADDDLNTLIYEFLKKEDWDRAISICKFSQQLPNISSEKIERTLLINYVIALKAKGDRAAAINALSKKDWSAVNNTFQLAHAVLCDRYAEAGKLMKQIGKNENITEMDYHEWPLFREFREQEEFLDSYEFVFGYKFALKLTSMAEEQTLEPREADNSLPI